MHETLIELRAHLRRMAQDGMLREPWLGDSESARVSAFYNSQVMLADDGPFEALKKFSVQLASAIEALTSAEETYRGTESHNAGLAAKAAGMAGGPP